MHVLICGGGVIGAATAYYLTQRGIDVTVIERTGIANAASGKSGGFLALDWSDGTPLGALARRSFALHAILAGELDEDYGYRGMTTYAGFAEAGGRSGGSGQARPVGWVSPQVALSRHLGGTETTAQVHPGLFTKALMRAAGRRRARVVEATVTGLVRGGDRGRVTAVATDAGAIAGDAVVIAMGPWSILACGWVPLPAVYGLKGHSLVFDPGTAIPPDALFIEFREATGAMSSPEVFPRADGTIYVCGVSAHDAPLPVDPAAVTPDPEAIARLETMCTTIAPALAPTAVMTRQSCFRPITADGLPLIGAISGFPGAYVATGHSVWGILNAPATGEAMAELIVDGATARINLAPFDPARLPAFDLSADMRADIAMPRRFQSF